jgi:hypothetical protein
MSVYNRHGDDRVGSRGGDGPRRLDPRFGGAKTVCIIDPENAGSIKVARKCGYREIARTAYHDKPTIMFERVAAAV